MEIHARNSRFRLAFFLPAAFMCSFALGLNGLGIIFDLKTRFGLTPSGSGILSALWALAYFTGCYALPPLTKAILPYKAMLFSNVSGMVILGTYLVFPSAGIFFALNTVFGFTTAMFWPSLMGWISHGLEGRVLARTNSYFSLSWSLGGVAAPFVAGLLAERISWLPTLVAASVFAANALFIFFAHRLAEDPPLRAASRTAAGNAADTVRTPDAVVDRSTPLRFPAWAGAMIVYIPVSVLSSVFPLFAVQDLGLQESSIGSLLLVRALATATGFLFFGRYVFWHFRKSLIVAPLGLLLLISLAMLAARSPAVLAPLLAAIGVAQAWAYGNSMFYGASGAPDRHKRMNIHESLLNAGQVVGSVGGGLLYERVSWNAVFIAIALIVAAAIAFQIIAMARAPAGRAAA